MSDNSLSIFNSDDNDGILKNPGDSFSAYVTPNGNKVAKLSTDNGNNKQSVIQYKNGTKVETKVTKPNQ